MEMRRFGFADLILFLIILLGAAGARVWYLYAWADTAQSAGPIMVQDDNSKELRGLRANLVKDHSFVAHAPLADKEEETAHTSPGYPWFLALCFGMFDDPDSMVRWVQAGLGALTAGLYFLFARRAFHSLAVATLAGAFCALHPFWIANTAEINDGVLASLLLALCLFLGVRGGQEGGAGTSLVYGLGLAALALVRAALLPFAVVALLWFLFRCRVLRRGWLCALLAFLGFINGLVPWGLRTWQKFHEVMPIVDSAYLHLWVGNNSQATGGPQDIYNQDTMRDILAKDWDVNDPQKVQKRFATLTKKKQPERYAELAKVAVGNMADDPPAFIQHRLAAGLNFLFGAEWFTPRHALYREGTDYESAGTLLGMDVDIPAVFAGTLLAMIVLGLLGWRWTYAWRYSSRPATLAVFWIPLPYVLGHAEAYSGPRLPLDGVLLCYAAFALACVVPALARPLFRGEEANAS
jgi:4-amino-4-deoxy-L-arabinose transferase-like glycosyltransferase